MAYPLFPLPSVVLFPSAIIPLHIFEPRYKEMVLDLLEKPEDERYLIISTMNKDDKQNYGYHEIGTLGLLIHHQEMANGRLNILVLGQCSGRIEEIESSTPYRQANFYSINEIWDLKDPQETRDLLFDALNNYCVNHRVVIPDLGKQSIRELIPLLCFGLPLPTSEKLRLLEITSINNRTTQLIELLNTKPNYINYLVDFDNSRIN